MNTDEHRFTDPCSSAFICGFRAEEIQLRIDSVTVPLLRARDIAAAVDTAALLGSADVPEPPYWMHIWPGAIVLARQLYRANGLNPATRVLELGCGLALPALCAARRGMRVVAIDRKREPLAFARASAARNKAALAAAQMDWQRPCLRGGFDLCLGADIAYDEQGEGSLVGLLARVLLPGGRAWLADSVNTTRLTLLSGLERAGFRVTCTEIQEEDEGRPVWVRLIEAQRA